MLRLFVGDEFRQKERATNNQSCSCYTIQSSFGRLIGTDYNKGYIKKAEINQKGSRVLLTFQLSRSTFLFIF